MVDVFALISAVGAFFLIAAAPGPAVLAVSAVSVRAGRRAGWQFGLGLSLGLAFWGVLAATGLGAILAASKVALTVMKLLGGAYLLWLAVQSARSAIRPAVGEAFEAEGRWMRRGILLNLPNPKAVLAWLAVLALGQTGGGGGVQIALTALVCSGVGLLIYFTYAGLFSMPWAMSAYLRASRWVDGVVAGLFGLAGLGMIRSALARG